MKKRFKLYLETSFWRRLADDASSPRRAESFAFLGAIRTGHTLLVSKLVTEELRHTTETRELKSITRRIESTCGKLPPVTAEVIALATRLLAAAAWGEGNRADMTHVARAMISCADALVTWDVADLAKRRTRDRVAQVASSEGLRVPFIGTPLEVGKWLGIAGW